MDGGVLVTVALFCEPFVFLYRNPHGSDLSLRLWVGPGPSRQLSPHSIFWGPGEFELGLFVGDSARAVHHGRCFRERGCKVRLRFAPSKQRNSAGHRLVCLSKIGLWPGRDFASMADTSEDFQHLSGRSGCVWELSRETVGDGCCKQMTQMAQYDACPRVSRRLISREEPCLKSPQTEASEWQLNATSFLIGRLRLPTLIGRSMRGGYYRLSRLEMTGSYWSFGKGSFSLRAFECNRLHRKRQGSLPILESPTSGFFATRWNWIH